MIYNCFVRIYSIFENDIGPVSQRMFFYKKLVAFTSQLKNLNDNDMQEILRNIQSGAALLLTRDNQAQGLLLLSKVYAERLISETDEYAKETAENQFIMDMYSYKGASPESPLGETVDLTDMAFDFPTEVSLAKSVVTPLKLKNDFHRVELLFSQNDCLALFLFLDVRESTKVIIGPQNNRMRFDFRENPDNNFKSSVDNYWGKSRQKYEAISNEMVGTFDHVYLKVVCPFYSVFGRDDLSFKITKLSESSQSNGEPIISKSNSSE